MKRLHMHISVPNLTRSIRFHNTLFDARATVVENDDVEWLLEDPRANFAIFRHGVDVRSAPTAICHGSARA